MVECAINDLGIIRVHEYAAREALAKGELIEILPKWNKETTPLYACFRQSRHLPSKIRCFLEFIEGKMAAMKSSC